MKRMFIRLAVGMTLLVAGFIGGRLFQHAKTGFHFKVLAEKEYGASTNPVRWRCVSESIGMPFLDPGTTIIEYQGRTIYKAQRVFQEGFPIAANIRVSEKQIDWDDGEFQFHLTVEKMKRGEPDHLANERQSLPSVPNSTLPVAGSHR